MIVISIRVFLCVYHSTASSPRLAASVAVFRHRIDATHISSGNHVSTSGTSADNDNGNHGSNSNDKANASHLQGSK